MVNDVEWLEISDGTSIDWRPESAYEIGPALEDEGREEELLNGAQPTEEELAIWEEIAIENSLMAEKARVYRSPEGYWFVLIDEGYGQGASSMDGAGPFHSLSDIAEWLVDYVRRWDGWRADPQDDDGRTLVAELERLSGKPPLIYSN